MLTTPQRLEAAIDLFHDPQASFTEKNDAHQLLLRALSPATADPYHCTNKETKSLSLFTDIFLQSQSHNATLFAATTLATRVHLLQPQVLQKLAETALHRLHTPLPHAFSKEYSRLYAACSLSSAVERGDNVLRPFETLYNSNSFVLQLQCLIALHSILQQFEQQDSRSDRFKILSLFKGKTLIDIAQLACRSLLNISQQPFGSCPPALIEQAFTLMSATLEFDQAPNGHLAITAGHDSKLMENRWAFLVSNEFIQSVFICTEMAASSEMSSTLLAALHCLELVVQPDRSLFKSFRDRQNFLQTIITKFQIFFNTDQGILPSLLKQSRFTQSDDILKYLSVVLLNLRSNFAISDFLSIPEFSHFMSLTFSFSVAILHNYSLLCYQDLVSILLEIWDDFGKSVYNLRMMHSEVSSHELLAIDKLKLLCRDLSSQYIISKLDWVHSTVFEERMEDDPLLCYPFYGYEDELSKASSLFHVDIVYIVEILLQSFKENVSTFKELMLNNAPTEDLWNSYLRYEFRISWIIHFASAIISVQLERSSLRASTLGQCIFQELCHHILCFMQWMDQRRDNSAKLSSHHNWTALERSLRINERLEISFLYFGLFLHRLCCFELRGRHSSQRLFQAFILQVSSMSNLENSGVADLITQKSLLNLTYWSHSRPIIHGSLEVLRSIANGVRTILGDCNDNLNSDVEANSLICKSKLLNSLFHRPQGLSLEFLHIGGGRFRSMFYEIISSLYFFQDEDAVEEHLENFLHPLDQKAADLYNYLSNVDYSHLNFSQMDHINVEIIGFLRDLRGLLKGCKCKSLFNMIFGWLYPKITSLLLLISSKFTAMSDIMTQILRLCNELMNNQYHKLIEDIGMVLFRFTGQVMSLFYEHVELRQSSFNEVDLYGDRYRMIRYCVEILHTSFDSGVVNIGVMEYYNDPCIEVIRKTVRHAVGLSFSTIMEYEKLAPAVYKAIESVSSMIPFYLVTLDDADQSRFSHLIESGLKLRRVKDKNGEWNVSRSSLNTVCHLIHYCSHVLSQSTRQAQSISVQQSVIHHLVQCSSLYQNSFCFLSHSLVHGSSVDRFLSESLRCGLVLFPSSRESVEREWMQELRDDSIFPLLMFEVGWSGENTEAWLLKREWRRVLKRGEDEFAQLMDKMRSRISD